MRYVVKSKDLYWDDGLWWKWQGTAAVFQSKEDAKEQAARVGRKARVVRLKGSVTASNAEAEGYQRGMTQALDLVRAGKGSHFRGTLEYSVYQDVIQTLETARRNVPARLDAAGDATPKTRLVARVVSDPDGPVRTRVLPAENEHVAEDGTRTPLGSEGTPETDRAKVTIVYFKSSGKYYMTDEGVVWPRDPTHFDRWAPFEKVVGERSMIAVCMEAPMGFPQMCPPSLVWNEEKGCHVPKEGARAPLTPFVEGGLFRACPGMRAPESQAQKEDQTYSLRTFGELVHGDRVGGVRWAGSKPGDKRVCDTLRLPEGKVQCTFRDLDGAVHTWRYAETEPVLVRVLG